MYSKISKDSCIVQKYGGTSVANKERIYEVAQRVVGLYREGWKKIALVVSAQSGKTNELIQRILDINPNPPSDAYDMALAAGEQISVALMSAAIQKLGVEVAPFLGFQIGILTDEFHSKARIKSINTAPILNAWKQSKICVIAGFQGVNEANEITTLGRGGSDTSAVALAVALNAEFCEINTDVDGVYTTDPRLVQTASLIKELDFESALEMASLGSKVLHPRCVELGKKYNLPLIVRNSFKKNDEERTIVMNLDHINASKQFELESPVVSSVTLDEGILRVNVKNIKNSHSISKLFSTISDLGVNVDIIIFNKVDESSFKVGFTVSNADKDLIQKGIKILQQESEFKDISVDVSADFSKVSVVGVGMRSVHGVASRTFKALESSKIDIKMVSTSEIKISCVVAQKDGRRAVQVLHEEFIKD